MHWNPMYDDAVELYNSGLSLRELARHYGVAYQSVRWALKVRGCHFRSHTERPERKLLVETIPRKYSSTYALKKSIENHSKPPCPNDDCVASKEPLKYPVQRRGFHGKHQRYWCPRCEHFFDDPRVVTVDRSNDPLPPHLWRLMEFLQSYIDEHGERPSHAVAQRAMNWRSDYAYRDALCRLEQRGYIKMYASEGLMYTKVEILKRVSTVETQTSHLEEP